MTSKTRSALTTEQTTNFADNTTGAITPAILRTTVQDMIDSMATQLDSSAFAGSAYSFTGSVAFSGVVAVGSAGTLFVSSSAGIFGGSASTANLLVGQMTSGVAGSVYGQIGITGSTSGVTTIVAPAAAGGTNTLQNTTDTFIYLSTTDTLNNKTIGSALGFAGSTSGTMFMKATGAAGSGTLTLPAATDTLVGKNTTDIFTNKTINTGSTNTIQIGSVTLSVGQYPATATNDNATAGNIGEYVENVVAVSTTSLATGSAKTINTITLGAGDWDVTLNTYFTFTGSTSITNISNYISGSTNTIDSTVGKWNQFLQAAGTPGAGQFSLIVQPYRLSLSASATSVFGVALATFGAGTVTTGGLLRARRAR